MTRVKRITPIVRQITIKTSMLNSGLCDYRDAYILAKGTIIVSNTGRLAVPNNRNRKISFKNCVPFTDCISEINNTQVGNSKDVDVVMSMYNLIEYGDIYSKTTGRSWQYYRDERVLDNADAIIDFHANDNNNNNNNNNNNINSLLFKFKEKIADQTDYDGRKDFEIMAPLEYLSNFGEHLKFH